MYYMLLMLVQFPDKSTHAVQQDKNGVFRRCPLNFLFQHQNQSIGHLKPTRTNMSFPKRLCLVVHISTSLLLLQAHAHGGHDDPQEDSTHDGAGNLHDKGLIRVKVWCLLIFLISTFAGGVSPYFYRWNESFLLLGTQFAGGIFLGTAMMHFLSDSAETFGDLTSKSYPFAFLLALVGYLLTMLGDCVVSLVLARGGKVRYGSGGDVEEQGKRVGDGDGHGAAMDVHRALIKVSSLGDTLLLIAALCFHSVFEGIAVGVAGEFVLPFLHSSQFFILHI